MTFLSGSIMLLWLKVFLEQKNKNEQVHKILLKSLFKICTPLSAMLWNMFPPDAAKFERKTSFSYHGF